MTHSIKAGEIVYNTWGYGQTNQDFYEVVKASACFVTLRKLKAVKTEETFMAGPTTPVLGEYAETTTSRHKVGTYGSTFSVNFEYGVGRIWNGQPLQCSWYN